MSGNVYEVRVTITSLEEASRLLKLLADGGFKTVSMIPGSQIRPGLKMAEANESLGMFNRLILAALQRAGATNAQSAITVEQLMENLREISGSETIFRTRSEGIISRTASMVASAVLGDKYGWVSYEKSEPRRFWLTEKGLKQVKTIALIHPQ